MDLSRSPSLDSEQQFALEQQRELQKIEQMTQQQPELTKQLDTQLGNNTQLNAELGKYSAEQQQEIKQALSSEMLSKSGPNLPQVDRVGLTKEGGIYVRFDEFKQVVMNPEQVVGKPLLANSGQQNPSISPTPTLAQEQQMVDYRRPEHKPFYPEPATSRREVTMENTMEWLKRAQASENAGFVDAYTYLNYGRNGLHLDRNDSNLVAAERYAEGYFGNYGRVPIFAQDVLKQVREVPIIGPIFGRNGSPASDSEHVTTMGFMGVMHREEYIERHGHPPTRLDPDKIQ